MNKPISTGLRTTFLVHFIVGLIFGLLLLLIPGTFLGMFGWNVAQPATYRLVGAAILGFTASSWFGYKAANWDQVRIVVLAELVWAPLATVVNLWGIIRAEFPPIAWINVLIFGAFTVAFWIFYNQHEAEAAAMPPVAKAPAPKVPARKAARRKTARR
jgi:hypothetical protein